MGPAPSSLTLGDGRRASYWTLVLATSRARERRGWRPSASKARRRVPGDGSCPLVDGADQHLDSPVTPRRRTRPGRRGPERLLDHAPFDGQCTLRSASMRSAVAGCVAKNPPLSVPSIWLSHASVFIIVSAGYPARLRTSTP